MEGGGKKEGLEDCQPSRGHIFSTYGLCIRGLGRSDYLIHYITQVIVVVRSSTEYRVAQKFANAFSNVYVLPLVEQPTHQVGEWECEFKASFRCVEERRRRGQGVGHQSRRGGGGGEGGGGGGGGGTDGFAKSVHYAVEKVGPAKKEEEEERVNVGAFLFLLLLLLLSEIGRLPDIKILFTDCTSSSSFLLCHIFIADSFSQEEMGKRRERDFAAWKTRCVCTYGRGEGGGRECLVPSSSHEVITSTPVVSVCMAWQAVVCRKEGEEKRGEEQEVDAKEKEPSFSSTCQDKEKVLLPLAEIAQQDHEWRPAGRFLFSIREVANFSLSLNQRFPTSCAPRTPEL